MATCRPTSSTTKHITKQINQLLACNQGHDASRRQGNQHHRSAEHTRHDKQGAAIIMMIRLVHHQPASEWATIPNDLVGTSLTQLLNPVSREYA
jgi:hypothetical protein